MKSKPRSILIAIALSVPLVGIGYFVGIRVILPEGTALTTQEVFSDSVQRVTSTVQHLKPGFFPRTPISAGALYSAVLGLISGLIAGALIGWTAPSIRVRKVSVAIAGIGGIFAYQAQCVAMLVVNSRYPPDYGPNDLVSFTVVSGSYLAPLLNFEAGILRLFAPNVALIAPIFIPAAFGLSAALIMQAFSRERPEG